MSTKSNHQSSLWILVNPKISIVFIPCIQSALLCFIYVFVCYLLHFTFFENYKNILLTSHVHDYITCIVSLAISHFSIYSVASLPIRVLSLLISVNTTILSLMFIISWLWFVCLQWIPHKSLSHPHVQDTRRPIRVWIIWKSLVPGFSLYFFNYFFLLNII